MAMAMEAAEEKFAADRDQSLFEVRKGESLSLKTFNPGGLRRKDGGGASPTRRRSLVAHEEAGEGDLPEQLTFNFKFNLLCKLSLFLFFVPSGARTC